MRVHCRARGRSVLPRYTGKVRGGRVVPLAPTPPSGAPVLTLPTPRPLTSFGRCQRSAAASPRVVVLPGSRLRPGMCSQCSAGLALCSALARPTRSPLSHPTSCPSQREPPSAMITCKQRVGCAPPTPLQIPTPTPHLRCLMTPGEGPGSLLPPPLTVWPANSGLLPHKPIPGYSQHPSPCPFWTPPAGARWRRAPQPTPRGGNIDAGASESIGASGGARRGAAARPVVVGVFQCGVGENSHEANLRVIAEGPCGWLAASLMAEVLTVP